MLSYLDKHFYKMVLHPRDYNKLWRLLQASLKETDLTSIFDAIFEA